MAPSVDDVVKILRSLLNTTKNGLASKQLLRDFREMENYNVPFKELGFNSFIAFLEATNEFHLCNGINDTQVVAKLSKDSIHVADMVSSQNRGKKKKNQAPAFIPRLRNIRNNVSWNNNNNTVRPKVQPQPFISNYAQAELSLNNYIQRLRFVNNVVQTSQFLVNHYVQQVARNVPNVNRYQQAAAQPNRYNMNPNNGYVNRPFPFTPAQVNTVPPRFANVPQPIQQMRPVPSVPPAVQKPMFQYPIQSVQRPVITPPNRCAPSIQQTELPSQRNNGSTPPPKSQKSSETDRNPEPAIRTPSVSPQQRTHIPMQQHKTPPKVAHTTLHSDNQTPQRKSVFDRLGPCPNIQPKKEKFSVQSRLNQLQPNNPTDHQEPVADVVDFARTSQQKSDHSELIPEQMQAIKLDVPKTEDAKLLLEIHCKRKNFEAPNYSTTATRSNKYVSEVCVGGVIHSTHPTEYDCESEAESQAASIAVSQIKQFQVLNEPSDVIAQKMYECIGRHGIWLNNMPDMFEQRYDSSLPDDWLDILESRRDMFVISELTNRKIVNKNEQYRPDMTANKLPLMQLPWDQPVWDVQLNLVNSTDDVWGYLPDSHYFIEFNNAMLSIEMSLESDTRGCLERPNITAGGIYLVAFEQLQENGSQFVCYRVDVQAVNENQPKVYCFYIDDGIYEWIDVSNDKGVYFYPLPENLQKIPALAIHFSLFNLGDFAENSIAKNECKKQMQTDGDFKVKIKSTQTQFDEQLQNGNRNPRIDAMFYKEDILLNKVILDNICEQLQAPALDPQNKLLLCKCLHVNNLGVIFCRLQDRKQETRTIKRLIARITANGIHEKYRLNDDEFKDRSKTLRLVFDSGNDRWYRAHVSPSMPHNPKTAKCVFVDYGYTKEICRTNIYGLDKLSTALSKYPWDAIAMRLNGFEPLEYNTQLVKLLQQWLDGKQVYVELQRQPESGLPLVNIRQRINEGIFLINDYIRIRHDISADGVPLPDEEEDSFSSDDIDTKKEQR